MKKPISFVASIVLSAGAVIGPAMQASGAASDRQVLIGLINDARARAGLARLTSDSGLAAAAQTHAEKMAAAGALFHSGGAPGAIRGGENVGNGPDAGAIHGGFMASSVHRGNILSPDFDRVGVGAAGSPLGLMVVEMFAGGGGSARQAPQRARPAPAPPPGPVAALREGRSNAPGGRSDHRQKPVARPAAGTASDAEAAPANEAAPAPPPDLYPNLDTGLLARMLRWEDEHLAPSG